MAKNKSVLLLALLIGVVLVAGCVDTTKPFFKEVTLANNFVAVSGDTALNFIISNPTQITFTGKVAFNYDTSCISITPQNKEVSVPNGGDIPFSVNVQIPNNYDPTNSCVGTKDIGLTLTDVNRNNLDFKTVKLNIVKR